MIPPESFPTCRGLETEYLHFVAMLAWMFAGGMAWLLAAPRHRDPETRLRRSFWLVQGVSGGLVAVACGCGLLDGYFGGPHGSIPAGWIAHVALVAAVVLQLVLLSPPRGLARAGIWRAGVLATVGVGVVLTATAPAASVWWLVAAAAGGGYLLSQAGKRDVASPNLRHAGVVDRMLAVSLIAVAAAWALPAVTRGGAAWAGAGSWGGLVQAVILAAAGWSVCISGWFLLLSDRVLPRIRQRRGLLGLRPAGLLPATQVAVLVCGYYFVQHNNADLEAFVARRLLAELRAVSAWISPLSADSATESPPAGDPGRAQRLAGALEALLASSEGFRAAAVWTMEAGRARPIAAANPGSGDATASARLLPRNVRELALAARGEAWVRWPTSIARGAGVVAAVPWGAAGTEGGGVFVSVRIERGDMGRFIGVQRGQTLGIVALGALVAALVLIHVVRTLNETELRALKETAEAENNAKSAFLAVVSHEVRTPLQSVLGYAELAQAERLPLAAARHVRAIRAQGAILLRIVQDILDHSALRRGRLTLATEAVSIPALVAEVEQALAERARAKGITLSAEVAGDVPARVLTDPVRLSQVLLNLTSNAVKFTSRGGVRLSVLSRGVANGVADLEFHVADTGPGIPPGQLRRIFEPFRKLRDDGTPDGGGVGLGLSICRQIVELLGGRIEVSSVEGDGTAFRVALRLEIAPEGGEATAPAVATEPEPSPAAGALAGLEILLVEDNPYIRELLREFLRRLGAAVSTRPDARSGLETARTARFDVVLLDIRLPDSDGAALASAIRQTGRSDEEPWIIGMSAGVSDQEIQRALEHGMNDFILKPVSMFGLAETIGMSPAAGKVRARERSALPMAGPAAERRAIFGAEAGPVLSRIENLCDSGDGRRAAAEAHYLANGCLALGLDEAFMLCRDIEDLAETGAGPDVRKKTAQLRDLLHRGGAAPAATG